MLALSYMRKKSKSPGEESLQSTTYIIALFFRMMDLSLFAHIHFAPTPVLHLPSTSTPSKRAWMWKHAIYSGRKQQHFAAFSYCSPLKRWFSKGPDCPTKQPPDLRGSYMPVRKIPSVWWCPTVGPLAENSRFGLTGQPNTLPHIPTLLHFSTQ